MASRVDGYRGDDLHRQAPAVRRVSDPLHVRLRWGRGAVGAKAIAVRGERPPSPRRDRAPARYVNSRSDRRRTSNGYQRRTRTATSAGPRPRGSRGGFIREGSSSGELTRVSRSRAVNSYYDLL